jgi:hypothetical protein
MKTKIFIIALAALFASCEKHKFEKENICPVISTEALPGELPSAFNQKYSGATNVTWFNQDNVSYCAAFTLNGQEMKAIFDKSGTFLSEIQQNKGKHHEEDENGCECDIHHEDHH